jgi:hypothetical protein
MASAAVNSDTYNKDSAPSPKHDKSNAGNRDAFCAGITELLPRKIWRESEFERYN